MLRKSLSRTVLVVMLGTISGCFIGTEMNMMGGMEDIVPARTPFGGTAIDIYHMRWAFRPKLDDEGIATVFALDTPFSIVGDIVTLPITVPYTLLNREVDPRFRVEKLEPTQQAENLPEIDGDMRQELNKATEPLNKLSSDEQPPANPYLHEHPDFLFPSAQ